ncbi:MAG: replication initiation protein [Lachnospiraceae bacterium]|nr:replication initiation protein [Lachnospiraceae bacterium]MDD7326504.1 replication initiation protein [Lachnospiraceae bacterium]MDY2759282.1 replication initiation protein [Lachnospiraceae bacterium]
MPSKKSDKTIEDELVEKESNAQVMKGKEIITAKYKSSLLENKLTSIALSRLTMEGDTPVATLYPSEIKKLLGRQSDTNIYKKLIATAKTMTGHQMVIEDNNGNFEVMAMITNAHYEDGVFTVTFNKKIAPFIYNIKGSYTSYSLANVLRFRCDYSFRIYELIKSEAWHLKKGDPNSYWVKDYGLSELKCMIGVVNMDEARVKKAKMNGASWDRIVEIANEKSFNEWGDFRRRVLERARKELREQCDVKFDYNPIAAGRGGKIVAVKFIISWNNPGEKVIEAISEKKKLVEATNNQYEQMSLFNLPESMEALVGHNGLSEDDVRMLLKESLHDEKEVLRAVRLADAQSNPIENYVGWIRECIRRHYKDPKMVAEGSSDKGDRIVEARAIIDDTTKDEEKAMSAAYWNKAMKKNSEKYREFVMYLSELGVTIDMFTDGNEDYECGEKFMQWIKTGQINPF